MKKLSSSFVALSLISSGAAIAQHSGSEPEQRACAGNVQRYLPPGAGSG